MNKDFVKALEEVEAEVGTDGALPEDWISTGNYCLNKLISGSYDKGLPAGRIIALAGESGTGKSLIAASVVREAQKKGYFPVIFDSEAALDSMYLKNLGVDPENLAYIPVDTIESFRNKMIRLLKGIQDGERVLFVLDSMGNLATEKEINDALEGKNASDMGIKSKIAHSTFRTISSELAKTKSTLIVTNHTYINAASYVPQQVMSSGRALFYNSSVVLMLKNKKLRDGNDINGIAITVTTEKNRFTPPFRKITLEMDFSVGLTKYTGLFDTLLEQGYIQKSGGWYSFTGEENKWRRKDFEDLIQERIDDILEKDVPISFATTGNDE